jgi:Cys/Met metabolism PLP-dependent enzyme
MTHSGVSRELREEIGLSEALIRISIGIENVEDWECQEFRVRAGIMGTKEISHGPTQRACDS